MTTKIPPELVDDQVFGNRNVIINGEMQIQQRGTQTGQGAANAYTAVDRMQLAFNATSGRLTSEQSTDAPDGFANSCKVSCTTADTSLANTEFVIFRQIIEGYNLQRFAKGTSSAKEFTVSFYVKGNASATYTCELYDADNTRQVSKTFAVTTSWNRIELTFPADTTGAFGNDNGGSLYLQLWLGAGSDFTSGTLNQTWNSSTAANRVSSSNSNFLSSTSNTFFITGFQLETGSKATPFEHRSYAEQLTMCQRYYQIMINGNMNVYWHVGSFYTNIGLIFNVNTVTEMRASPTLINSSFTGNAYRNSGATGGGLSSIAGNLHSVRSMGLYINMSSGTNTGNVAHFDRTGGELALNAELT